MKLDEATTTSRLALGGVAEMRRRDELKTKTKGLREYKTRASRLGVEDTKRHVREAKSPRAAADSNRFWTSGVLASHNDTSTRAFYWADILGPENLEALYGHMARTPTCTAMRSGARMKGIRGEGGHLCSYYLNDMEKSEQW